jgi:hypothetical protein
MVERNKTGKKREMDLCRVLFQFTHGNNTFTVFQAKEHTAKLSLLCSKPKCTRRRFHAKMLPTCSYTREILAGEGACAGEGTFAVCPLGHTAKPCRYCSAVLRGRQSHVSRPLPWPGPLPCASFGVRRVPSFAVFFFFIFVVLFFFCRVPFPNFAVS